MCQQMSKGTNEEKGGSARQDQGSFKINLGDAVFC